MLTRITTPAKNGVYDIGYTNEDRIQPTEAGYYVIVTRFAGDDRVQPFAPRPAQPLQRGGDLLRAMGNDGVDGLRIEARRRSPVAGIVE